MAAGVLNKKIKKLFMHSWLNKNPNHPACISDAGKQYSYSELKGLAGDFYARINHRTLVL
jgi:hypothetical protein